MKGSELLMLIIQLCLIGLLVWFGVILFQWSQSVADLRAKMKEIDDIEKMDAASISKEREGAHEAE